MSMFRKINKDKYVGGRGATTGVARSEKRRGGRIKCSAMTCECGVVEDLSATGIRAHARKRPPVQAGETRNLTLRAGEEEIVVKATCVWVRVDDDCEFDTGWELLEVSAASRRTLMQLAATAQATEGLSRGWAPMKWWGKAG